MKIHRYQIMSAALTLFSMITGPTTQADGWVGHCSKTSLLMERACRAEGRSDLLTAKARCFNEKGAYEQRECIYETRNEFKDVKADCNDVFHARQEICAALGQAPYDPLFEPEDFDSSLSTLTMPNTHYPLQVGHTWTFGGDEDIYIEVLNETKFIDDINCFVVQDVVTEDGLLVEDTDDWFAISRLDGAIWYCGEEVKDYEYFDGDVPSVPELVSTDGSFKVERDGDRAGIVFPGNQLEVGDLFRQEYSLGNAEDMGEVLSVNYSYGNDAELDEMVPQALAELLCDQNCIVIGEFTPLEPGVFERKYYAPGIGNFLATDPVEEESVQLIDCNFNALCADLPDIQD